MPLVSKANEAVALNPPTNVDIHLTSHGSDWLWSAFSLFAVFAFAHLALFLFKGKKVVNVAALGSSAILAYTYFTMASDLGWTAITTEFDHVTVDDPINAGEYTRQIFYARYIGWFLAWPVVLFLIDFVGNGSKFVNFDAKAAATYALEVGASEVYVVGLLIGSLVSSTYKWGYFTFATTSLIFLAGVFNFTIFRSFHLSNAAKCAVALLDVLALLYPINWGLSEGGNVIQPDSEHVFYGILDLLLFAVIPTVYAFEHSDETASVHSQKDEANRVSADSA